jgi:uncharacterized membrane protein
MNSRCMAFLTIGSVIVSTANAQVQVTSLGPIVAYTLSADGRVAAGREYVRSCTNDPAPLRWTTWGGTQLIGPVNGVCNGTVFGSSADGSVLVGGAGFGLAFRWTEQTGAELLGFLPGHSSARSLAVSGDGSVVVGSCGTSTNEQPFVWTQQTGMMPIPVPGARAATAISADGNVVVGTRGSPTVSFLWRRDTGHWFDLEPVRLAAVPVYVAPAGRFVVGTQGFSHCGPCGWIWTPEYGYTTLPSGISLGVGGRCTAYATNIDGTVIIGECNQGSTGGGGAVVWRASSPAGPYQAITLVQLMQSLGWKVPPNLFYGRSWLSDLPPSFGPPLMRG